MRDVILLAAALSSVVAAQPTIGESLDEKQPFICAPIKLSSCGPKGECEAETAETMNMPQFLTIDVAQRQIRGKRPDGEMLSTVIDTVHNNDQSMTLQGTEGPIMWSVMIERDSGDMVLTVGGHQEGFIVFGACTPGQVRAN
jgi:hypothetical protein